MRVASAMLYVLDFPRMKAFYAAMLGAPLTNGIRPHETWAEFDLPGSKLALHAIPAEYAREIEISSPPEARESGAIKLIFEVENITAERDRIEALGGFILPRQWHADDAFDCLDPEGNVFQVVSATRSDPTA
jgi:predicted enzyme related to lactoylglutathione lyase